MSNDIEYWKGVAAAQQRALDDIQAHVFSEDNAESDLCEKTAIVMCLSKARAETVKLDLAER